MPRYMPRRGVPFFKSIQNGEGRKARTPAITGVLIVVPWVGIEPTLPKELDFESSASTNSATKASGKWFFPKGMAKLKKYSQRVRLKTPLYPFVGKIIG